MPARRLLLQRLGPQFATERAPTDRHRTKRREQNRTQWDAGLEWARIDGPFSQGATGEVKLRDQPARKFEVIECQPMKRYTDRFFLPMGTTMDWLHTIDERGDNQRQVTFRVVVNGPTSLGLTPVVKSILGEELPPTVDKLIELAEKS